jgi:hypothetical protein
MQPSLWWLFSSRICSTRISFSICMQCTRELLVCTTHTWGYAKPNLKWMTLVHHFHKFFLSFTGSELHTQVQNLWSYFLNFFAQRPIFFGSCIVHSFVVLFYNIGSEIWRKVQNLWPYFQNLFAPIMIFLGYLYLSQSFFII